MPTNKHRVTIVLESDELRKLSEIGERFDKRVATICAYCCRKFLLEYSGGPLEPLGGKKAKAGPKK